MKVRGTEPAQLPAASRRAAGLFPDAAYVAQSPFGAISEELEPIHAIGVCRDPAQAYARRWYGDMRNLAALYRSLGECK